MAEERSRRGFETNRMFAQQAARNNQPRALKDIRYHEQRLDADPQS